MSTIYESHWSNLGTETDRKTEEREGAWGGGEEEGNKNVKIKSKSSNISHIYIYLSIWKVKHILFFHFIVVQNDVYILAEGPGVGLIKIFKKI